MKNEIKIEFKATRKQCTTFMSIVKRLTGSFPKTADQIRFKNLDSKEASRILYNFFNESNRLEAIKASNQQLVA